MESWVISMINWILWKSPIREEIYFTVYLNYTFTTNTELILIYVKPPCFLVQWSMTALVSHGCCVMEGDCTFDWTGGGMLLEQSVVRLCVWWCLCNPWQQGPAALDPALQPVPQWLLGDTDGWGKWWSTFSFIITGSLSVYTTDKDSKHQMWFMIIFFIKCILLWENWEKFNFSLKD